MTFFFVVYFVPQCRQFHKDPEMTISPLAHLFDFVSSFRVNTKTNKQKIL